MTERPPEDVETALPDGPLPDPPSILTQRVLDSGLAPIEDAPIPAYRTNEGTVYLGSPADLARVQMCNGMVRRGVRWLTDAEVDRLWGV